MLLLTASLRLAHERVARSTLRAETLAVRKTMTRPQQRWAVTIRGERERRAASSGARVSPPVRRCVPTSVLRPQRRSMKRLARPTHGGSPVQWRCGCRGFRGRHRAGSRCRFRPARHHGLPGRSAPLARYGGFLSRRPLLARLRGLLARRPGLPSLRCLLRGGLSRGRLRSGHVLSSIGAIRTPGQTLTCCSMNSTMCPNMGPHFARSGDEPALRSMSMYSSAIEPPALA